MAHGDVNTPTNITSSPVGAKAMVAVITLPANVGVHPLNFTHSMCEATNDNTIGMEGEIEPYLIDFQS